MTNMNRLGKILKSALLIFFVTGIIASVIIISIFYFLICFTAYAYYAGHTWDQGGATIHMDGIAPTTLMKSYKRLKWVRSIEQLKKGK
ncbi:hypothetical protein [Fusibacter sp. 3D3]|uniref:hypothetical protein n=1 Tax=Fusibacter sp. 3D3 TaxID=1048380 RepID=UPI0008555822|nr:hypothetical protein [Fusibacter sp. 3D3]GAU76566.1 hypothetical protein F3D3_1163 [Fusibacter sp. 3D3]